MTNKKGGKTMGRIKDIAIEMNNFIELLLKESYVEMLAKALENYTPKKEEEEEYKELLDILKTLVLDEY
jgi:hypothetical protein